MRRDEIALLNGIMNAIERVCSSSSNSNDLADLKMDLKREIAYEFILWGSIGKKQIKKTNQNNKSKKQI